MGKFSKGLFLGGLLGAVLTWLNVTKEGQKMRDKMLDNAAEVYGEVKKRVLASPTWKTMSKNEYVKLVNEVVDEYAVKNGLADRVKAMIVKVVSAQWKLLQAELKK